MQNELRSAREDFIQSVDVAEEKKNEEENN